MCGFAQLADAVVDDDDLKIDMAREHPAELVEVRLDASAGRRIVLADLENLQASRPRKMRRAECSSSRPLRQGRCDRCRQHAGHTPPTRTSCHCSRQAARRAAQAGGSASRSASRARAWSTQLGTSPTRA